MMDYFFNEVHLNDEGNAATLIVTDRQYVLCLNGADGTFRHLDIIALLYL